MRWFLRDEWAKKKINNDLVIAGLYYTYMVNVFRDGDHLTGVWNFKNPLVWAPVVVLVVVSVVLWGVKDTLRYRHALGIGLSPYWRVRKDNIDWL